VKIIFAIKEAIIVEGNYDKIKLQQIVDAVIITTDGFGIFSNTEKMKLIRRLAEKDGIIVFTDCDGAGFLIRNYIKECIPPQYVKHAYIPEIKGKEKRKDNPGKEGLLGVEGMKDSLIIDALKNARCNTIEENFPKTQWITIDDFFRDELHGRPYSRKLRQKLTEELSLPSRISTKALLDVLNRLYTMDEYKKIIERIKVDTNLV